MELDSLEVKVQSSAQDAASAIDKLAASLGNLKSAARGGAGLSTLSRGLDKLNASLSALNVNSKKLGALTDSLSGLSGIKTHLTTTANQLNKLNTAIKSMDADIGKVQQLASALTSLGNAPKLSGLTSSMRALQKSQRVLGGGGAYGGVSKAAGLLNLGAYLALFREAYQYVGGWLEESNNYVENLNLFTVAMGEYASAAKSYAEEVQAVMGIDASAWMRNQGVFQQMTTGFGVVSEDAALMSKNLTQLGYDISSFYNIPIEEAMTKLQSGLAGEIEPLRRLGYAIDEASLKQVALRLGITESIEAMTQAEKSQLRYVAIMQQSTNAMGDLSRTMQTPANAIRILQQQIVQLSRALGNLLIPFLQIVIPWVQAFVVVLTEAIQALAALVGFELPTIDYSGVGDALDGVVSGGEDASGALGDATDAAKELKRSLLGFDELNVLSAPTSAAGGAGGGASAGSGNDLGLDLPEYDFLGELEQDMDEMVFALKNNLRSLLEDYILPIGAGFASWKIAKNLVPDLGLLKGLLGSLMVYAGMTLLIDSIDDIILNKKLTWGNILNGGAGGAIAGAGLGLMLAKKWGLTWKKGMLLGAAVGLGLSLMIMSVAGQLQTGVNPANGILEALGGGIAGAGVGAGIALKAGGSVAAGAAVGATVGVGVSLILVSVVGALQDGIDPGDAVLSALGGGVTGAGVGAGIALKKGVSAVSGAALGAVVGVGVSLTVTGVVDQLANGQSVANQLLTVIGSGIAGAGLGFTLGGPVGAAVGLGLGLAAGVTINTQIAKGERDEASFQAATEAIKTEAQMSVVDAVGLFQAWYDSWIPDNQVVLELAKTKETLAEDVAEAHKGLQGTFDLILQDGVLAEEELGELTAAVDHYFAAITADTSANNDVIHEALVGALQRASADGVGYYQDLIDKHDEWVLTEQGVLGALQTQVTEAQSALALAAPGTSEYAQAQEQLSAALSQLNEYVEAENSAKLQTYADKVEELTAAINSGELDTTQLTEAQAALEELAGDFQTALEEIETARDNVMLAVQTEINRAASIGDNESVSYLGDIKSALEEDFAKQESGVISAANGIGATIAKAIGEQVFNLSVNYGTTATQNAVDTYFTPLLSTWASEAEGVITNSEQLKGFPQKALDAISSGWTEMAGNPPDLDMSAKGAIDDWVGLMVSDAQSSLDDVLEETNLGPQAQAFMDGLTAPFASSTVNRTDITTGLNNFVSTVNDVAGIHSPADITKPVGEALMAGIEEGFKTEPELSTTFSTELGVMLTDATDFKDDLKSDVLDELESSVSTCTTNAESAFKTLSTNATSYIDNIISKLNDIPANVKTTYTITTRNVEEGTTDTRTFSGPKRYAEGGFPDEGELFIAREAGPELVGRIGGRTAVANNDQIVASLAMANEEVVNAVMAIGAMIVKAVNDKDTATYLDGRKVSEGLYGPMQTVAKNRGASLVKRG